ncbi:hypothetical protein IPH67_03940 [bacterium]|nr:MAG: hypothetical protein IPH67_03940 [bacterium]
MKNCTFFYKTVKNVAVVLLLLLTVDCRCMFLGVMQHVITKLPFARFLIAAMAKQSAQKQGIVSLKKIGLGAGGLLTAAIVNKKQVKAEHVLYREGKDQNIIPLDENEYNKIAAEVVDQHQWPTAIKNRKYNPDVDETKVIQEKLDQQFPGVKAMWIPDTLFDLVDYAISQKSMVRLFEYQQLSKHFINTEIIHKFSADLQKIETLTWQARTMLFKLMVKKYAQATKEYFQSVRWLSFKDVPSDEIIDKTIDAEAEYKMNHPAKMLF